MKLKRIIIRLAIIVFVVVLSSLSVFADSVNYPENFIDYTPEKRIEWIDKNVSPIVEQGTLVSHNFRNIVRDYTSTKVNYAYDSAGNKLVGLRVGYYWRVNMDSTIEYYGISEQTPLVVNGYFKYLNKKVTS